MSMRSQDNLQTNSKCETPFMITIIVMMMMMMLLIMMMLMMLMMTTMMMMTMMTALPVDIELGGLW